jgi:hypothetical protein
MFIELFRSQEMLELLQASVRAKVKSFASHVDSGEHVEQLSGSRSAIVLAPEARQQQRNLLEADAVAPVVAVTVSYDQLATRKSLGDDFRNAADLVILRCRTDIEDLVVNQIPRRLERCESH